jgi:hypothetical protein
MKISAWAVWKRGSRRSGGLAEAAALPLGRHGRLTKVNRCLTEGRQTRPHGSPPAQTSTAGPPGRLQAAPLPHRCLIKSLAAHEPAQSILR